MSRSGQTKRWLRVLVAVALVIGAVPTAQAQEWDTRGGTTERQNQVTEAVGLFNGKREEWPVGQSASQPLMVDQRVFHLAGRGLYRFRFGAGSAAPEVKAINDANINPEDPGDIRVSSSTPTYSPSSGLLYFGTAHGYLWHVNTRTGETGGKVIDYGCSIVSSPLVLQVGGRDVVVFGMKPQGIGCTLNAGKIYAVWGLDGKSDYGKAAFDIGGWPTMSPVPVAEPTSDSFLAASDGPGECAHGRVVKLRVVPAPDGGGYTLEVQGRDPGCVPHGVDDGFAVADGYAYWVDNAGVLWGRRLSDGAAPSGWPDNHVDLVQALGGGAAFTNTVPAVDTATGTLFVTLRNYSAGGADPQVCASPDGCTGQPGAMVAINLRDGSVKGKQVLPAGGASLGGAAYGSGTYPSLNTNPLVIRSRGAVVYADVNGDVYSRALEQPDAPAALGFDRSGSPLTAFTLLNPGEQPMRVSETFRQVSGAGTEPMIASGTMAENAGNTRLLVGVNYKPPAGSNCPPPPGTPDNCSWKYGRLVAIPVDRTYNLRWTDPNPAPTQVWQDGESVTLSGNVLLDDTTFTLGALRKGGVDVTWFMVPKDWDYKSPPVHVWRGAPAALPGTLKPGDTVPVQLSFQFGAGDPDAGMIYGVIDSHCLSVDSTRHAGRLAAALLGSNGPCPAGQTAEEVLTAAGGNGLNDNFLHIPFQRQAPPDLTVSLQAPSDPQDFVPGNFVTVTWTITNQGGATPAGVSIPYRATLTDTHGQTVPIAGGTVPPMGKGESRSGQFPVPLLRCDDTLTVRMEVNPAADNGQRAVAEADTSNNAGTATITVNPCQAAPPQQGQGGGSITVIVPPDCVPNPDLTSDKPCLNYDLRIPGWNSGR